jgi:hypothetical protein
MCHATRSEMPCRKLVQRRELTIPRSCTPWADGGGFAQHVYLHANRIASVWGNDREVLTTDGDESVGNFAAGTAQAISADGTNITLDCYAKPGTGNMRGGQVTIIAGGAAGQIRRIVVSYGAIHPQPPISR